MSPSIPRPLHLVNEGLAFLFELIAIAALAWWGFTVHVVLGVGAPLLAVLVWGLFAAPKARFRIPLAGVLAVKALVFGAATAALFAVGHPVLAITFAILAAVNTAIATVDRNALMNSGRAA